MNRIVIDTDMNYQCLAPELRAQVEAITINWDAGIDDDELERYQALIQNQLYNPYPNTCNFDPNTSRNNEDILEPQSRFQAQEEESCLDKNLEAQSSHLLNVVAEEIQGELPSATMKNQEEKVNTLPLEIGGQLGEVEIMPAETKQEDVPKKEEEKAQVSFEVFNGKSLLTKSDFNDCFVIGMVDDIL
ncbi:hypothetical protein SLEP1_g22481 [Rubroshorea leprosula]|uniref:Uncharacterized protein n=1 Tax=Rubroshorea leprosula TaxID=152421 RepID=A0AAV5JGM1_9ROSI|nr:hypothetical protein SLEP1_g22481 [Rubroshorea leprosula]